MRSHQQLRQVQHLLARGVPDAEIAALTGIPRRTVCDWRRGRNLVRNRALFGCDPRCTQAHDFSSLPEEKYAYVLGLYLGDGYISQAKRGVYRLRITLDARYTQIISECQCALNALFPGKNAHAGRRRGSACVDVSIGRSTGLA